MEYQYGPKRFKTQEVFKFALGQHVRMVHANGSTLTGVVRERYGCSKHFALYDITTDPGQIFHGITMRGTLGTWQGNIEAI